MPWAGPVCLVKWRSAVAAAATQTPGVARCCPGTVWTPGCVGMRVAMEGMEVEKHRTGAERGHCAVSQT